MTRHLDLALTLAALGWHVFPLAPRDKRPLANCLSCRDNPECSRGDYAVCPCLPDGQWCHGVRAATTDPDRIRTWWRRRPDAVPAIAAGPSGLVLIDLDAHTERLPSDPAAELLPGIRLIGDQVSGDFTGVRTGRDVLLLLARLRGGPRPWPTDPGYQPATVTTPSGGRHLWYRAPHVPDGRRLRQALGQLGWQIDIKAGWSYGIAPGATTVTGHYQRTAGDPARVGRMPEWLAEEVLRVAIDRPAPPAAPALAASSGSGCSRSAAYLVTVIDNGAAELAALTDGRKSSLSALAYKTGGLLAWSGLSRSSVEDRLVTAGTVSGLPERLARRIVHRALTNGLARPLAEPKGQVRPTVNSY
ncbi:bifunctional DNA primase/polymerase [Actinomadura hibisca]|uniref:bifunctional DNA primase/polymerase n=1 Tax=Actinomadura hibisca TaxID=68565 RepID=UPI0008347251|nr:bifunctional DNA primase/polymerase [Actinomadura hibisca]